MRPIKFRLRIGKKIVGYEKWYQGSYGEIMTANACWLYSKDGEAWLPSYIFHKEKDQFTGLFDKQGKEIYEGDIVKAIEIRLSESKIKKGIVTYKEKSACFYLGYKSKRKWDLSRRLGEFHEYEVIGDAFENPELFKESK